jgi:metacaspase-1
MAKGLSLHIGLNLVDPKHYQGWDGALMACEADAHDMADIARDMKFVKPKLLLTKNATRKNVIDQVKKAARTLKAGDYFFLSYSGHGGQLPDFNDDELDNQDETWCLYNGEIVDDELYSLYADFKLGVRILVLSDSCHSGSVTREIFYRALPKSTTTNPPRYRAMPNDVALRTYRGNRVFYDKILQDKKLKGASENVKASVLLISGCQDNQLSSDGTFNGLFTSTLLQVWWDGKFKGDYRKFHRKIVDEMPPEQTPNYFWVGEPNKGFEKGKPFLI